MATRRYTATRRLEQLSERQQRVARAAAELHAEKGVLGTTYADIAQRAGVSLPTVYSYFPTQDDLLRACSGHVVAQAPPLPVDALLAAPDLSSALRELVAAVDRSHAHFEPWAAWREEQVIPFLAQLQGAQRAQLVALLARLLARHGWRAPPATVAVCETLLSFDTWHRLVRQHRLSRKAVREILELLLRAALGPAPPASSSSGPRSSV